MNKSNATKCSKSEIGGSKARKETNEFFMRLLLSNTSEGNLLIKYMTLRMAFPNMI